MLKLSLGITLINLRWSTRKSTSHEPRWIDELIHECVRSLSDNWPRANDHCDLSGCGFTRNAGGYVCKRIFYLHRCFGRLVHIWKNLSDISVCSINTGLWSGDAAQFGSVHSGNNKRKADRNSISIRFVLRSDTFESSSAYFLKVLNDLISE